MRCFFSREAGGSNEVLCCMGGWVGRWVGRTDWLESPHDHKEGLDIRALVDVLANHPEFLHLCFWVGGWVGG